MSGDNDTRRLLRLATYCALSIPAVFVVIVTLSVVLGYGDQVPLNQGAAIIGFVIFVIFSVVAVLMTIACLLGMIISWNYDKSGDTETSRAQGNRRN